VEQEGDHRAGIVSGSELSDQPLAHWSSFGEAQGDRWVRPRSPELGTDLAPIAGRFCQSAKSVACIINMSGKPHGCFSPGRPGAPGPTPCHALQRTVRAFRPHLQWSRCGSARASKRGRRSLARTDGSPRAGPANQT
jgi:hypothetical protein